MVNNHCDHKSAEDRVVKHPFQLAELHGANKWGAHPIATYKSRDPILQVSTSLVFGSQTIPRGWQSNW